MNVRTASLCVGTFLAFAVSASAIRIEFIAEYNGKRVPGTDVCFFRAGEIDEPVARFMASDDVRCMPADKIIDVTPGRWGYVLRNDSAHRVNALPALINNNGRDLEEAGYKQIVDEVRPAATIDLAQLRSEISADERLGVFVANEDTKFPPALLPVGRGENRVLVPAASSIVVIGIREGEIVAVTDPVKLAEREVRDVRFPDRQQNRAVVAWVGFTADARNSGNHWSRVPAPDATLTVDGRLIHPRLPTRPAYGSDGMFLLFEGVPAGAWRMHVGGGIWRSDDVFGEIGRTSQIVSAKRSLRTAPVAAIRVRWTAGIAPTATNDCAGAQATPQLQVAARRAVRLLSCGALQPGLDPKFVSLQTCTVVALADVPDNAGRIANFDAISPGTYLLEVNEPGFAPMRQTATVDIGEVKAVDLNVRSFDFFGRVTLDGQPLRARLEFFSGSTASDQSGAYDAHLPAEPRALPVSVINCDSGKVIAVHVPSKPIPAGLPYDIAVRHNRIEVTVDDAQAKAPLQGARVTAAVVINKANGAGHFLQGIAATDEHGRTSVENVPTVQDVILCAHMEGFESACGEPFQLGDAREKTESFSLQKKSSRTARVQTPVPPIDGWLVFVTPGGKIVEASDVSADGTFRQAHEHIAPEYAVFTAANLPLFVIDLPASTPPDGLNLLLTAAAVRDVDVSIGSANRQQDATIGIYIGGRYVPDQAFFRHQALRRMQSSLRGRGPLRIAGIAESAPIRIVLGPAPSELPATPIDDVFLHPEFVTGRPSLLVGTSGHVVFE